MERLNQPWLQTYPNGSGWPLHTFNCRYSLVSLCLVDLTGLLCSETYPATAPVPSLRIPCPKTRFTPGNSLQSVPISLTSLRVRAASPLLPGQAHGKVDEDCCALGTASQTCWWSWAKYIWVEGEGERERENFNCAVTIFASEDIT